MNSNSFMRVQVRVQKKYFFDFKFEFGKMIEFFRVRSLGDTSALLKAKPGLASVFLSILWV